MKIKIDGWKCNLTFSSAHFLTEYSKCSLLHGHTYAVHVIVEGKVVKDIVIDFKVVKNTIRQIIAKIDHKMIIPTNGEFDIKKNNDIEIMHGNKRYIFPKEDCVFLPIYSSSAENLATYILKKLVDKINSVNITKVEIGIDEGYGQGAWEKWEKKQ